MYSYFLLHQCASKSFFFFRFRKIYSPESKASRESANLTERKNLHTPVYGVREFVCLSVCPSVCRKFGCLGYFGQPVFTLFDKKSQFLTI